MKSLIYFLIFFFIQENSAFALIESKIVLNVEDQIVSSYELKNKIKTILILNQEEVNQENINKTKDRAIQLLINYELKKKEVSKYNISAQELTVKNYLKNVSSQYSTDSQGFKKLFSLNNIDYELYLDEIKTEFAWQNLIFRFYKDKINLNEKEIEKDLKIIIDKKKNIEEYNLSEISIILEDYSKKDNVIKEIKDQINTVGFKNAAKKFSISSSSLHGGNLGWINSKSLSKKIFDIVKNMKVGDVSQPLLQSDNLIFLKLNNKKIVNIDDVNVEQLRNDIINKKKNASLDLYSNNHLSKIKNKAFIQFR